MNHPPHEELRDSFICVIQGPVREALEEARTETDPERDGLLGETEGDNAAHVIVRGELLHLLFDDPSVNDRINDWVTETPLTQKFNQVGAAVERLAEATGVPINDLRWNEQSGFTVDLDGERFETALAEATDLFRSFMSELKSHTDTEVFQMVLEDALQLSSDIGLPYQWLATELAMVYTARIMIPGFSWRL